MLAVSLDHGLNFNVRDGDRVMRALAVALFTITIFSSAHAQRAAEALPAVSVDCYQSFATKTQFPESPDKDLSVANDDLATSLRSYSIQVVGKTILKIVRDPDRDAFREEPARASGRWRWTSTTSIRLWLGEKNLPGGIVRLFTFDFADLLLSRLDVSPEHSPAAGVELHVMKCSKSNVVTR
jgi:hypothetical protein